MEDRVDMVKYNNSLACIKLCDGCNKKFYHTFIDPEQTDDAPPIVTPKCLAYHNPPAKWPKEGQKFAMHTVMVREKGGPVAKDVPILEKYCPLASHFKPIDIVDTSTKIRSGQQKQK